MTELAQAMIVATLSKILPSLGRMIDETDHPFAVRVRELKPAVWPTDEVLERLKK